MGERFGGYGADGEASEDRWSGAVRLFAEGGGEAVLREEETAERWERAGMLFGERKYADAAAVLVDVVAEFPEQVAARMLLARAYYHSAQLRRAERELRAVIERDPVEHYAHLMLGRTLERQGRKDEAAPWLRLAGALSGDADT
ncbi:tetratricopeptide repeat protein [Streptomyces sp. NBC_01190]|uniref:tetratricopeptide repeat protein n=1 Tax=Streptomyces sp. NBC_01190 TaxID=2903767 RepID=UPI0038659C5B|nr:tetratricopeptide repeat protein [Streptomyces sp. NBC_01190]